MGLKDFFGRDDFCEQDSPESSNNNSNEKSGKRNNGGL